MTHGRIGNIEWMKKPNKDNKTFCILPWIHLHPWPNGTTMLCCKSPYEKNIGNLRDSTLKEVWNSGRMKSIRKRMLNDKKSSECMRCYEEEKIGVESLRITSNRNWLDSHWDKVEKTNDDGSLDDMQIIYFDFRFSNLCNMKCRYCGPELSSNWFDDAVEMRSRKASKNPRAIPKEKFIQIRKDVVGFMDEIEPMLEYVEQIYWAGGEPLIMDEHWVIMNKLVELGKTDIRIFYNTNFSYMKYQKHNVIDLWKNFDNINVGASLDAMRERGEYQRHGTNWKTIEDNIQLLRKECPQVDFHISCTLSAYNAHHVTEFHREWVDKGWIEPGDWDMNILLHQEYFRISVLPEHHKEKIKEKWREHLEWLKPLDTIGRATRGYESALLFIEEDYSHLLPKFKDFNKELDEMRGENFYDVFTEYQDL